MAIIIAAKIVLDGNGSVDVKLSGEETPCITHEEQVLLERLKPVFHNFIVAELDLMGVHLTHTYKDECAPVVTH